MTGPINPGYLEEDSGQLVLDLDGFDGPIDLLLSLARDQKVDLSKISILALAEQYLAYVEQVRRIRLELAADYLVMAAWLAYLKSRLLLPQEGEDDEPSGEELAEALSYQLRRLEAMRQVANDLFGRPLLGDHVLARGDPDAIQIERKDRYAASLYQLLGAYGAVIRRQGPRDYAPAEFRLFSVEDAIERLGRILGRIPGWAMLSQLVNLESGASLERRSELAATFGATLELAKRGLLELRQDESGGPIYFRARPQDDSA